MEKVTKFLIFMLTVPALLALPLVDENTAKPLQVRPLAAENKTSDKPDESTEVTYIEQTFIEVLVPGTPQLNSTAIASILNGTANNSTTKPDRPVRDIYQDSTAATISTNHGQVTKQDNDKEAQPSSTSSSTETVNTQKLKRQSDSDEDVSDSSESGSDEESSEEGSSEEQSRYVRDEGSVKKSTTVDDDTSTKESVVYVTPKEPINQ